MGSVDCNGTDRHCDGCLRNGGESVRASTFYLIVVTVVLIVVLLGVIASRQGG